MGSGDWLPNTETVSKHAILCTGSANPRVDRFAILLLVLASSVAAEMRLCRHLPPIRLAAHHDGPSDAGGLVGERDGDQLARLARQQFEQPGRGAAGPRPAHHGGCAHHAQASQGFVALPADLSEPMPAARPPPALVRA